MDKRLRLVLVGGIGTAAVTALVLAVTVGAASGSGSAAKPRKVEFNVIQAELKGSTTTDKLAPPTSDPAKLSDAYGYKAPGAADPAAPTKWEVSAYQFITSGAMTACKGDTIALRLFAVNGDEHKDWVEAPNGDEVVKEKSHNRGREYVVTFRAKQSGVYTLICNKHEPTMKAPIRVFASC